MARVKRGVVAILLSLFCAAAADCCSCATEVSCFIKWRSILLERHLTITKQHHYYPSSNFRKTYSLWLSTLH